MYYIVYIRSRCLKHGSFTVIPEGWIREFDMQKEKFLNKGLNSNQLHVCFWTHSERARNENGVIDQNFAPNWDAGFDNIFPGEGCYLCQIIVAKGNIPRNILLI